MFVNLLRASIREERTAARSAAFDVPHLHFFKLRQIDLHGVDYLAFNGQYLRRSGDGSVNCQ